MTLDELLKKIDQIPKRSVGFYPTPFHELKNLSRELSLNVFMKREDLAGPGFISGGKTRIAEYVLGAAKDRGATHAIIQGTTISNSISQLVAACRVLQIEPFLILSHDIRLGRAEETQLTNLALCREMGADMSIFPSQDPVFGGDPTAVAAIQAAVEAKEQELLSAGHSPIILAPGGGHLDGIAAHCSTFCEMAQQASSRGIELDYIYHTTGTGMALPALVAAKIATQSRTIIRSFSVYRYSSGQVLNIELLTQRTEEVLRLLGVPSPGLEAIAAEIHIDESQAGERYGSPTRRSREAALRLARTEGVLVGPVYTGKGLAGLLHDAQLGRLEKGSSAAFIHTGDTGNALSPPYTSKN